MYYTANNHGSMEKSGMTGISSITGTPAAPTIPMPGLLFWLTFREDGTAVQARDDLLRQRPASGRGTLSRLYCLPPVHEEEDVTYVPWSGWMDDHFPKITQGDRRGEERSIQLYRQHAGRRHCRLRYFDCRGVKKIAVRTERATPPGRWRSAPPWDREPVGSLPVGYANVAWHRAGDHCARRSRSPDFTFAGQGGTCSLPGSSHDQNQKNYLSASKRSSHPFSGTVTVGVDGSALIHGGSLPRAFVRHPRRGRPSAPGPPGALPRWEQRTEGISPPDSFRQRDQLLHRIPPPAHRREQNHIQVQGFQSSPVSGDRVSGTKYHAAGGMAQDAQGQDLQSAEIEGAAREARPAGIPEGSGRGISAVRKSPGRKDPIRSLGRDPRRCSCPERRRNSSVLRIHEAAAEPQAPRTWS